MRKAVLDTNVIVSAIISPNGKPAKVMELFFDGEIQIFYSFDILAEYKDVLFRPNLALNPIMKEKFLGVVGKPGILIEPTASTNFMPDESDRKFYDAAKETGAILVTGNIKHFPKECFIMTPAEFLENHA